MSRRRNNKVDYRRTFGSRVFTTTVEGWDRIQSNADMRRQFVLIKDYSEMEVIKDEPIKLKTKKEENAEIRKGNESDS